MRNRPIRKSFKLGSSDDNGKLKHLKQSDDTSSECHDKATRKSDTKSFSFRKGISRTKYYDTGVNENAAKHRHLRIFKSFRKKDKAELKKNIKRVEDGSFRTLGLKSNRHDGQSGLRVKAYGKVQKTKRISKNHKEKLETYAAKEGKQSTLQRMFSLRIKSRTDSQCEKVDVSSLVKMVNFKNTGKRLATRQTTMIVKEYENKSSGKSVPPDLDRNSSLKHTGLEFTVLSPTCGDLYGSDEEGLTAFSFEDKHLSGHKFNETHVLDRKISLDTTENNSAKSLDCSKHKSTEKSSVAEDNIHKRNNEHDNHAPEVLENCETYSNLTFHLDDSDKSLHKGSSDVETIKPSTSVLASDHDTGTDKAAPDAISDLPSFKKILDNNDCDKTIENFGNPWVLKSDCPVVKERTNYSGIDTGSPVSYKSLGFSVNTLGGEKSALSPNSARKAHGRIFKRSTSVESMDSFSSSIHSVKSEECFFSSDSEDDQADIASISSSDSFTSAKDYADQTDFGADLAEKIKSASSLDHLDKTPPPVYDNIIKQIGSFDAFDTTPVAKTDVQHTYSVDDVHRIIQRPSSLSISKGYSLDSASKTDKTPKNQKKKVSKRRSLDSSFKTPEMKSEFKAELEKQKLKPASSDSGLSSILSPVQENANVKLRSNSNIDSYSDKMYYTLPNPRKTKSYPPLLPPKRKPTRIGSLSKMLSEKAESFSGLKLGTSFKLRNLEKPITSGLNKTKSLTNLMSKKGIRVVSSISSMILGKSTSDTNIDTVDSPFKPKNKKPRRTKDDENEFVYEKVKVLVPRKRPANQQELVAERRRLTLDLKLANLKQNELNLLKELGINSKPVKCLKKENNELSSDSSSSVGSVKSPTMLDEIMKSVDTRRFSMGLALDIGNVSDNELNDTNSRSSSTGLATKKRSIVSDITTPGSVFLSGEEYFSLCPRCKKLKHCLETGNNFDDIALEKRTHSLIDVNSCCACLVLRNSCDSLPFDERNKLRTDGKDFMNDNEIIYFTPCGTKKQTSRSLQELRNVTDLPFQNYMDTRGDVDRTGEILQSEIEHRQSNHKARRSLPYTLMKCQPCLDLSADDLDEIGSIEEESDHNEYLKTAEKSHSCSDLLDSSIDTDPVIYCERPLERKPSKRGDRPPVKVKSLSSSHDALTCLSLVDIPDINNPLDNVNRSEEPRVTKLDSESGQTGIERKAGLEESSDSGNEDYHSVGSDSENLDISTYDELGRKNSENLDHTPVQLENSLDSGLTMPDSQVLLNSFQDMNMVSENCKVITNRVSGFDKSDITLNTPSIDKTDFKERSSISDSFQKERKCSGCLLSNTNSIIPKEQNLISAERKRQCFSVGDVRITCCDNVMGVLTQTDKSASVSDLNDTDEKCPHCGLIKECVSKSLSNPQQMKANILTKVVDTDSLKQQGKDTAFESKASKFLFDDQHVKSYKNILSKARGKSVSSDDVNMQSKLDSEMVVKSSSVLSLSKPSHIHDKLHIDPDFFPPNLSPLNRMFKLPPFQGFSAFSPPADGSQLPELEEVYRYDVCLGYLVHSITCDNKTICVYSLQRNKQLMEGVITPISGLPGAPHTRPSESSHGHKRKSQKKPKDEDMPNPAAPITVVPSEKLSHAGHVLRTVLLSRASHMIRDRKFHLRTYRRCMVGTEMVDWLLQQSSLVHSRTQAVGMWQALVEEGVIVHVCHEHQFKDKYLFYRFLEDDQGISSVPSTTSKKECEDELQEIFLMLAQIGPDAMMRMILRKLPHERTVEDLEIIYEELLHIKALSHLSTMVKRELASVLVFESHAKSGTVLFNQGDEGKSWYIILKGSVNVVIYGKGVVCTLHEGDDFGKLALVNDAPRAATIVLRDDNCHFLRVDKDDFNRILRDVEANTVRLKEHGQDVLVLEKIPTNTQSADGTVQAHYKYSIMAGTPEKMLEHLLETMLGNKGEEELSMFRDGFLEDFLLTHVIFMPCNHLCPVLLSHYHSSMSDSTEQENFEYMLTHKKCVLHFVQEWARIVGGAFKEDHTINAFLEELHSCVLEDQQSYFSLREDIDTLENILEAQSRLSDNQLLNNSGTHPSLSRKSSKDNLLGTTKKRKVMKATDENIFKVYCADHTYCTLRLPMDSTVEQILSSARDKLCLGEDLVLCEVKSTGERVAFKENDLCVTSGLSINGRLFITPREHLDALTPLPEQEGPPQGSVNTIELVSSREMAYYMTVHDWDLFSCVQEYELIYQVFGRYKFRKITANLDLFLRRFNEIQYWVVTEMVLATNLSKRVALLRKFIKLASYCKEYQNLNSFFAIVMGLSNIAVSRLSQTWEKLPGKFKKMFADFETLMDPSRNHRVYRLSVAKMVPPIIPFMPLLMKDMTFTHEGNKTYFDGLVNFEKMHMIAQTLKTVRFCRSSNLELEIPSSVKMADISNFIKHLIVIDNQRHLTQLSQKLEPRKT